MLQKMTAIAGMMVCVLALQGADAKLPLGTSLLDTKLPESAAKTVFSVAEALHGKKALVLFFMEPQCPVCQNYIRSIQRLGVRFKENGVAWAAIDTTYGISSEEIASHAKDLGLPLLHDKDLALTHKLGVDRVPCVIVADSGGKIRYRGRIDDQFSPGVMRKSSTTN
ncbi:MAG: redoxin domain-containing protein, partial [Gemmataceae bacterium]|nr:redoxin domain-containing protein [Gemmataceae bacterium]